MKRILITGASRGIGRAIAEKLAGPDVSLILLGRDEAALATTQRRVQQAGAQSDVVTCDLSEAADVERCANDLAREPLHVLINNAGIAVVKPFTDVSLGEWQRSFAVNVTAPFLLTQRLAPSIPAGGSVVNILSIAAKTGFPGWSSYAATKFALEGFMQSVRDELRPLGVRVINVYPAATDTDIWESVEGEWPREKMMSAADIAESVSFALARPANVAVENIRVSSTSGML